MTRRDPKSKISRRDFLTWTSVGGAALVLGLTTGRRIVSARRVPRASSVFAPSEWIAIDASGTVTIVAAHSEMGQGVRTSLPMIVAEGLGADWTRVRVVHARPGPAFPNMRTSGSSSVSDSWSELRRVAAAAREMLIAAAATSWGVATSECLADRNAVVHKTSGRRLEFGALVGNASRLSPPANPALKSSSEFRLLGTRVPRVDTPLIVTGRAVFGLDVRVPGMRYAAVARPPRVGAKVRRYTDARARAIPGVFDVVALPTGVAVIAADTWTAFRGRDALEVDWDVSQASNDGSIEYRRALEDSLEQGKKARREGGDVDAAFASAARRLEQAYYTSFQAHAALEPLNCVADVRSDRCEIWTGSQAPNQVHDAVSKLLGLPLDRVTVNVTLIGGGFGRRLDVDYVLEAVEVSRAAKAPVQVVWTREDDVRHDMYQPAQVNRLSVGLDARDSPVGWRHRVADYNLTMFGAWNPDFDPAADGDPWGAFDTPYSFPALDVTLALLKSPVPTGAWRSVTYPAAVFARESFLDEIAHATGRDPLALRLALVPSPGMRRTGGVELPNGDRLRRVLELVAARAQWATPLPRERDGRLWGRGLACNAYHNRTMVAQVAEVSVGSAGDLRVHRVVCAVDCGQVINLSGLEAQFEGGVVWALSALTSEITFEQGRVVQGNYSDYPVMRLRDAPLVEVHVVPSDLPPMGIGEQPVPAVTPAVLNAVYAATGKRIRRLPLRATDLRA